MDPEYLTRTQVVGPGGPTGVAMSPARDMGPRLAHWVLPIRGKGSSEFLSYSCVPVPISSDHTVARVGCVHLTASGSCRHRERLRLSRYVTLCSDALPGGYR